MTNPTLLTLRLEGPLQSWGLRSKWDYRDTGREPSKSGIIGILGCALGYPRNDKRLEEELNKSLRIGVREELQGNITMDYHIIRGKKLKADGSMFKNTHSIVTRRYYLEDSAFLVVILGPEELLKKCVMALKDPIWVTYLGRKSCPPTRPIYEDLTNKYASIDNALKYIPWDPEVKIRDPPLKLRCILEDINGTLTRLDNFRVNPSRSYEFRRVTEYWIQTPKIPTNIEV